MVCVRGETELETWLLSQGFPVSFGGWDFKHWTCDDLRRAIRFFDRHAHVEPRKIEMCQRLCIIRPEVLTQAEQQEVNRIRAARQADRVLQDRSYSEALTKRPHGKKRQRSNSNDSERSEITAQPSTPKLRPTMRKQRLPTPSTFLGDRKHSIVFAPQGTPALPDWGSWSDYPPTPPTPTPATRECQICVSAKPVDLFPSLPVDAGCQHSEPITCISCLARHIEARSQTSQLNAIPCPEPECTAFLSYTQMQRYAVASTFARYDNFLNHLALRELPDFHPCTNPTCDSGSFGDHTTSNYMICSDCGTRSCITCNTPWHPGLSHKENQERIRKEKQEEREMNAVCKLQEESTERTLQQKTKLCPNENCGIRLWKAGGCDHMTCGNRKYEFCWLCLAEYDQIGQHGNRMHVKGCRYHRPLPKPKGPVEAKGKRGKRLVTRVRRI